MKEPSKLALNDLREQMPDVLRRLKEGERFIITRHNSFVALLTPIADLRTLAERTP